MTVEQVSMDYDSGWQDKYSEMVVTPDQAVSRLKPGQRVFIGTACAEPQTLVKAMCANKTKLVDIEIVQLLTMGEAPYTSDECRDYFQVNSFFVAENVREIIQKGLGDYTPILLSDIPELFESGKLPLDAALIQVTQPDRNGVVSLGVSVDIVKSAVRNASLVIAQVNPEMPRTLGDSLMNVYDLDLLVPVDEPLIEIKGEKPNEVTDKIGQSIATLVEDGSTLELGIGRIPHSVLRHLSDKKDLGIHTEMLTDSIVDLVEAGVVNCSWKTIDRGKITASFCIGSRKLYDYIHNNPIFSFHPTEYINDQSLISRQHKMVAVNMALEVDLTGQVCADSLGTRFFSGIGGQVDFNRGAARSLGGKAIIAMPSTAQNGEISRIVTKLTPGAGVVTTRGDVHYVVTEYGIAYLHGKKIQERAMALICIAHPDFRAQLLKEAIEANYLRHEKADVEGAMLVTPSGLKTTMALDDGTQISFRPINPTDEHQMKDLLYALSQETVYYRFMSAMKRFSYKQIQRFVYVDNRNEVAIVGVLPEVYGEEIIAVGRYYLDPSTNKAEVAFVARDEWQHRGIGKFLFKFLTTIARRNGIKGFTAETLADNRAMQSVFDKSGLKVKSSVSEGVYSYEMDFD